MVMFHDGVEDWPELIRYEGLGLSEYSSSKSVLSPFDLSRNAGDWLAGYLD
jgi:hypothetical protein